MRNVPTVIPDREKIRQLRLDAGLTPNRLAREMELLTEARGHKGKRHGQTIRKIESDGPWSYARVSVYLIHELASALGVKASEIIKAEPDEDAA